jgi:hypothetical protein
VTDGLSPGHRTEVTRSSGEDDVPPLLELGLETNGIAYFWSCRGEGDVVEDPGGDVAIDGTGLLPAGGTYHRVAAPAREKCFP